MANTYRRKNRGKHQSRKPRKSRKSRKSRKGGFFKMPITESLKKSMADGAAKANEHYKLAKQKTEEQIKKTQVAAQPHLNNAMNATTEMKNQALIRASGLSQSGVPQSNEQYGPSMATILPTIRSQ